MLTRDAPREHPMLMLMLIRNLFRQRLELFSNHVNMYINKNEIVVKYPMIFTMHYYINWLDNYLDNTW